MTKSTRISRRAVLKGVGAALPLPFLDAMSSSSIAAPGSQKPPTRFACLYMPNGAYPANWNIDGKGGVDYKLSPILKPLEDVRDYVMPISNLDHGKKPTNHQPMVNDYLTANGNSIDIMIANQIGDATRYPYILLGTEPAMGGAKFICSTITRQNHRPIAPELHPQTVFDRLFQKSGKTKVHKFKSVLDVTLEQNKALARKVGRLDRNKLDQYSTSIREVETRLDRILNPEESKRWKSPSWNPSSLMPRPASIPDHKDVHTELMLDLMLLAFWTDNTRVSTMMFGNESLNRGFEFLDGVTADHHVTSHWDKKGSKLFKQYTTIGHWHVQKLRSLMKKMQTIDEGGSTLLDHSLILFGSCMGDGMRHKHNNLPIVLAGKAGGRFKPGRHLVESPGTSHDNMLLSTLNVMGVDAKRFGSSTGTLHL